MPIVVHLDRLLYERELSLTELSGRIGMTVANLSILKTGKARAIRFSTLEAICRELECQPGEVLEHIATTDDATGLTEAERAGPSQRTKPGEDPKGGR